jgi:hypothetical protein
MTNKRDWTKIRYYPVSLEKLQQASMKEAAILLLPMNIGEDYEHFDKVKHLLDIPEEPKDIEYYQKELEEKFEKLIETTKEKFEYSKVVAEKRYKYEFDKIFERFEYAKDRGHFPPKLTFTVGDGLSVISSSYVETSFVIKQGNKHEGYYTIGNQRYLKYYMFDKPNFVSRFFMNKLLGFVWVDEK